MKNLQEELEKARENSESSQGELLKEVQRLKEEIERLKREMQDELKD